MVKIELEDKQVQDYGNLTISKSYRGKAVLYGIGLLLFNILGTFTFATVASTFNPSVSFGAGLSFFLSAFVNITGLILLLFFIFSSIKGSIFSRSIFVVGILLISFYGFLGQTAFESLSPFIFRDQNILYTFSGLLLLMGWTWLFIVFLKYVRLANAVDRMRQQDVQARKLSGSVG